MKSGTAIVAASLLLFTDIATANWTVKRVEDLKSSSCYLESDPQQLHDGYQDTSVYLVVTDKSVQLRTASDLDGGFSDIGMQVEKKDFIPMDGLEGKKTARFDSHHAQIVEEFIRGLTVRVDMRFWPTWPTTGVHPASFSLVGFTKAYSEMSECK